MSHCARGELRVPRPHALEEYRVAELVRAVFMGVQLRVDAAERSSSANARNSS